MTKKKTTRSKPEASSTTVISVRFSEAELDHVKAAASILDQPPASWVRQAAVRASTETINALKDPKHAGLLARVSQQIAEAIVNREVEVTEYHGGSSTTTITHFYGEEEHLQARAVPVDEKTLRTACQVLEHASSIFARALGAAIESRMAGDDVFSPIASPSDGE